MITQSDKGVLTPEQAAEQQFIRGAVETVREKDGYFFCERYSSGLSDNGLKYMALSSSAKDQFLAEIISEFDGTSKLSFVWKGMLRKILFNAVNTELDYCFGKWSSAQYSNEWVPSTEITRPSEETLGRLLAVAPRLKGSEVESLLAKLEKTPMPGDLIDRYRLLAVNTDKRDEIAADIRARQEAESELESSVIVAAAADESSLLRKLAEEEMK